MPLRLWKTVLLDAGFAVLVYPPLVTRASSGAYVSGGPICHSPPLGLTCQRSRLTESARGWESPESERVYVAKQSQSKVEQEA